jgi:hypothetical protein
MTLRTLCVLLVAASGLVAVPSASGAEPSSPVTALTAQMLDSMGDPEHRAGVHPDRLVITIDADPHAGNLKDLIFQLPPGFAGDSNAVPTCPRRLFSVLDPASTCPTESQIGVGEFTAGFFTISAAIFNVEPDPGTVVELGFKVAQLSSRFFIKSLPNGQAEIESHSFAQDAPLSRIRIELWGVPADNQTAPVAPRRGFLATPTHCPGTPPEIKMRVRTWQAPDVWHAASADMGPPLVGCEDLEFESQLGFTLGSSATDSPTGARMDLAIPQNDDVDGKKTAAVKDVHIRFPDGVAMSPSAANQLTACPEESVGLGRLGPTSCPPTSKIGTAEMSSPLLENPLSGTIYLGKQQSATEYRTYVAVMSDAIDLKLPGTLRADPDTGQLRADFLDLPEVPFERLTLDIGGGPNGLLVTSLTCGLATASVMVTPYSGGPSAVSTAAVETDTDPFGHACPVDMPFAPSFVAGTSGTRAGGPGPLSVTIHRASGEQLIDRFAMTLPPGMSAGIASVQRCAAVAAAAAACPSGSRIGSVVVEAGSGPSPASLEGDAFLTGPYRRAPLGLALVFRGVVGPFDLGTVVTRAAFDVDPRTAQVKVETDRLPRMLSGVPLRIQTLALDVDRPGFMTNPTSCAPSRVAAVVESVDGIASRSKSRFAVGGCRALRFRRTVSMALTDRSELHVGGFPGVRMELRARRGGANLRDLSFELPKLLEPSVTGPAAICSLTQLEDDRCPAAAKIGAVSARTPILTEPLKGSVYTVQPPGNGGADAWGVMHSMGISVRFRMTTVVKNGQVRGKIVGLPDIPISRFTMAFTGGKHGLFSMARRPCVGGRPRHVRAKLRLTAHNAATRRLAPPLRVAPGC